MFHCLLNGYHVALFATDKTPVQRVRIRSFNTSTSRPMPIKEGVPLHDPCEDIPQLRVSSGPTQSILSSLDSVKLLTVYMSIHGVPLFSSTKCITDHSTLHLERLVMKLYVIFSMMLCINAGMDYHTSAYVIYLATNLVYALSFTNTS